MKISAINFNLFRTNNATKISENQQNPFAVNNTNNPFAGGLQSDVFQNSSIQNVQPNAFAQKTIELYGNLTDRFSAIRSQAKEFFAPAISFAGKVRAGFDKLNSITVEDMYNGLKKEISLLTLDKDVRKYVKMPVADLREELVKELA